MQGRIDDSELARGGVETGDGGVGEERATEDDVSVGVARCWNGAEWKRSKRNRGCRIVGRVDGDGEGGGKKVRGLLGGKKGGNINRAIFGEIGEVAELVHAGLGEERGRTPVVEEGSELAGRGGRCKLTSR